MKAELYQIRPKLPMRYGLNAIARLSWRVTEPYVAHSFDAHSRLQKREQVGRAEGRDFVQERGRNDPDGERSGAERQGFQVVGHLAETLPEKGPDLFVESAPLAVRRRPEEVPDEVADRHRVVAAVPAALPLRSIRVRHADLPSAPSG